MPQQSAIVIVVDGLGAGWTGPYGNTWIETPGLNQLAAQSVLAETLIADAPDLSGAYRAYWSGRHALAAALPVDQSLADLAAAGGLQTLLITDEHAVANHPLAGRFAKQAFFEPPASASSARAIEKTALFQFFANAAATIADCDRASLVWLHSRGLTSCWDAPLEYRNQFADEDDPPPPAFVDPPTRILSANGDPDELLGLSQACAGQVVLLDQCIEMFLDAVSAHPILRDVPLIFTSPRGYPLGEHLHVGHSPGSLYGELLHVPLLLRLSQQDHALARLRQIAQPHDLFATIANICSWPSLATLPPGILAELTADEFRPGAAYSIAANQRSIRTPAWFHRESLHEDQKRFELFAKPDDRFEANEISGRCPRIVEMLADRLDEFSASAAQNPPAEISPLAELLCDTWR